MKGGHFLHLNTQCKCNDILTKYK